MGAEVGYLYDNANVVWYGTETYTQAINALQQVSGKSSTAVETMLNGQYGAANYYTALQALEDQGVVIAKNTNGYNCFAYASDVTMTAPSGPISQLNSNATVSTTVQAAPVFNTSVDSTAGSATYGKVVSNPVGQILTPSHGFYGWDFFAVECLQGINAASVGITLGKTIDSLLYNANPDYWDSIGLSSLDPATWSTITNGDDSFAAGLFNMVLGIDPNSGKAQAFIDENAFSYLAYALADAGWFDPLSLEVSYPDLEITSGLTQPFPVAKDYLFQPGQIRPDVEFRTATGYCVQYKTSGSNPRVRIFASATQQTVYFPRNSGSTYLGSTYTYNGKTVYYTKFYSGTGQDSYYPTIPGYAPSPGREDRIAWIMVYGDQHNVGGVDGVDDQPNATLPDTTNWASPTSTLPSLQQQYPGIWGDAVPVTTVQPDGSTKTITYVPVSLPNVRNPWDAQPTSSTSTQANPMIEPLTDPTQENNDLLRTILQLLTLVQPEPDTETQTETQPQSPYPIYPDVGTGDSPTPVAPTGSASALWSVYHPTQAQINSFGAWLWGSVFTTDIRKLFEDPIQGVIKLHKVFATPVDSGTGTIVVGTLDSQVSSATVTQQYVTVDCGYVDCAEYFGAVFDYAPYTEVSLYLPFIGIVPLDVNDIMRSTIHVVYGVDVFTGACLAMVEVSRDNSTVNMYQYSGVCSVDYPLSNVQAASMLSGLLAVGAGVAAIATGGLSMGAAGAIIGGAATASKKSIGRSGGFSGNSGAMGIKKPYLIIQRPIVKTASAFPLLEGYPTNYSVRLGDCANHVVCKTVHVSGVTATESELEMIEELLKSGVEI